MTLCECKAMLVIVRRCELESVVPCMCEFIIAFVRM